MEYLKEYREWNILKEKIARQNNKLPYFKEGDMWWCYVGVNIGYEEDGKGKQYLRPVLILRRYSNNLFLGVPLSTKLKAYWYYHQISIDSKKQSIIINQLRTFDSRRLAYKLTYITQYKLLEILEIIILKAIKK